MITLPTLFQAYGLGMPSMPSYNSEKKKNFFDVTPTELVRMIALGLSDKDLAAFCLASKRMNCIGQQILFNDCRVVERDLLGFITTILSRPDLAERVKILSLRILVLDFTAFTWVAEYRKINSDGAGSLLNNTAGTVFQPAYDAMGPGLNNSLKLLWAKLVSLGNADAIFALLLCVLPKLQRLNLNTNDVAPSSSGFIENILNAAAGRPSTFGLVGILENLKEVRVIPDPYIARPAGSFAALAPLLAAPKLESFEIQELAIPNNLLVLANEVPLKRLSLQTFKTNPFHLTNLALGTSPMICDLSAFTQLEELSIPQLALPGFENKMGGMPFWEHLPCSLVKLEVLPSAYDIVDHLEHLLSRYLCRFPDLAIIKTYMVKVDITNTQGPDWDRKKLSISTRLQREGVALIASRSRTPDEELQQFFADNEQQS